MRILHKSKGSFMQNGFFLVLRLMNIPFSLLLIFFKRWPDMRPLQNLV